VKVLVFGAGGSIGRQIVHEAVTRRMTRRGFIGTVDGSSSPDNDRHSA
jgi:uncharacterized protein YbjT (DUF2867 family)